MKAKIQVHISLWVVRAKAQPGAWEDSSC